MYTQNIREQKPLSVCGGIKMFSRLVTMLLFTWSVYMAAFGQERFGREHIKEMANNFGPVVSQQSDLISKETVRFFADISPSAGDESETQQDQSFSFVLVDSLTSQEGMSFLEEGKSEKDQKDQKSS